MFSIISFFICLPKVLLTSQLVCWFPQGSGPAAPPTATATTRKRKIEKEEKDSTGREGRKTRTEQPAAGPPGVPMVFGKQYLRAAEHAPVDGEFG